MDDVFDEKYYAASDDAGEDLEKDKDGPFYNENKRKKKQKVSNSDLNTYNPTNSIELDF